MNRNTLWLASLTLSLCLAASAPAQDKRDGVKPDAQPSPEQSELSKVKAENDLADQFVRKRLRKVNDERDELKAKYELELQKQKDLNAGLEAELAALASKNKLAEEKRKADTGELTAEYEKLAAQNKIEYEKSRKLIAELAAGITRIKAENDLKAEQQREAEFKNAKEKTEIEMETKRLELEERRLKVERMARDERVSKLAADLDIRLKKAEWKKESNTEPVYSARPFSGGKLVISDRRIALNGPIMSGVASYVNDRIHYYNNISTQPIFIVIDKSPGGSVMEGYRILKAMEASKAPVYVVVKSFAASMAAVITTMADKSYVYPNAILLHHQMSTVNWGNMTQLKEQLEMAKEWERRLHLPISRKMGVSLENFRKTMYEKSSDGDWEEFGDKAVGYKWATAVVDEIEETGITKDPDESMDPRGAFRRDSTLPLEEKVDETGRHYVSLPRLDPFDFYFIYNPDRYYR